MGCMIVGDVSTSLEEVEAVERVVEAGVREGQDQRWW